MRRFPAVLALILLSAAAQAQQRPQSADMSCGDARELVQARSAVVLGTGGRNFDRYFATRLLCAVQGAEAVPATVPTADDPACPVGFLCQVSSDD